MIPEELIYDIKFFFLTIHYLILNTIGYKVVGSIAFIVICIWAIVHKYRKFKNQYSDEAWKIVKKNGRKSIFWYDEYGNKTYKKPDKSNPPGPHKRGIY